MIRKHTQNIVIDVISFLCLILLLLTGLLIHYVLPRGSHDNTFWGLTRHEWGDIHFWIAIVFFSIIVIHLILHSSWIKASFFSKGNRQKRKDVNTN